MSLEGKEITKGANGKVGKPILTDWGVKEREADQGWIQENLSTFKMIALTEYDELGPGIILVQTFEQKDEGGHPYGYLPKSIVEAFDNEDVIGIVKKYEPQSDCTPEIGYSSEFIPGAILGCLFSAHFGIVNI
jgi:hypothetical protein